MERNEGKACDAAIRRIEAREGALRTDPHDPEEEGHPAPVDFSCTIAGQLCAFEHTVIEPFELHFKIDAKAGIHFDRIRLKVEPLLPKTEHFVLHLPVKAMLPFKGRELTEVQDVISAWIAEIAPTLPGARLDRYVIDTRYQKIPELPFEVALHRVSIGGPPGQLSIVHLVDRDMEAKRADRIRQAYQKKAGKLAVWRELGARTVLILEICDIQLTNAQLVANAVNEIEPSFDGVLPDEVYLFGSFIPAPWYLWTLRAGGQGYYELSRSGNCMVEFDPKSLTDLTGR